MAKQNHLLLPFFLLILNSPLLCQQAEICGIYGTLIRESKTKFVSLSGEELADKNSSASQANGTKRNKSTLLMEGASSSYIQSSTSGTSWVAELGSFKTKEEALQKIKDLQKDFFSCVPKLEFFEQSNPVTKLPFYTMKESRPDGFSLHKMELGIFTTDDNKFIPYMKVPENATVVSYGALYNEPDTSTFGKEINQVVVESAKEFKNMMGDKKEGERIVIYQSKFCITDCYQCIIEDNHSIKLFKTLAASGLSQEDADKAVEQLGSAVASAIGKKYVWNKSADGTLISFIEATEVPVDDNWKIAVKKVKTKEGKFNVFIVIKELETFKF